MYKTLGGYSWSALNNNTRILEECPLSSHVPKVQETQEASILESAQQFQFALENLKFVSNLLYIIRFC